jgi:ATP-dependent RNA helicase DeaD
MNDQIPNENEPEHDGAPGEHSFTTLQLAAPVQKAIEDIGYETPSPIQAQAIPPLLEGKDLLGIAQTGTGKTAAFALPMISRIDSGRSDLQLLCLAPTRELAIQVAEAFQNYARHVKGFRVIPIYGGADIGGQIRHLKRGVQVVVGTPGRVMDHMRRGSMKMDHVKMLVLDEADEMLKMGFQEDVEWILEHMQQTLQIALFSATMPAQINRLAKTYLKDPAEIHIKVKQSDSPAVRQKYVAVHNTDKMDMLTRILDVEEINAALVFVRTKNATVQLAEKLRARGHDAEALSGDVAQSQREKIVSRLRSGKVDLLIATDVAARGLDVDRITHVFNYDLPYDAEQYVHRIGRTGRAGREGDAILFVTNREQRLLRAFEKATRQSIEPYSFPSADLLNQRKIDQLFGRVDSELQKDLKEYESVIKKYMEHNATDPMLLAAAFASLQADSQPFYFKDAPLRSRKEKTRIEKENRSMSRSEREQLDADMKTYKVEVGKKHRVTKGDLVGAIANEAGLESRFMGKIFIFNDFSTIDLPGDLPEDVITFLKTVKVRGRALNITLDAGGRKSRRHAFPGKSDRPARKSHFRNSRDGRGPKRAPKKSKP